MAQKEIEKVVSVLRTTVALPIIQDEDEVIIQDEDEDIRPEIKQYALSSTSIQPPTDVIASPIIKKKNQEDTKEILEYFGVLRNYVNGLVHKPEIFKQFINESIDEWNKKASKGKITKEELISEINVLLKTNNLDSFEDIIQDEDIIHDEDIRPEIKQYASSSTSIQSPADLIPSPIPRKDLTDLQKASQFPLPDTPSQFPLPDTISSNSSTELRWQIREDPDYDLTPTDYFLENFQPSLINPPEEVDLRNPPTPFELDPIVEVSRQRIIKPNETSIIIRPQDLSQFSLIPAPIPVISRPGRDALIPAPPQVLREVGTDALIPAPPQVLREVGTDALIPAPPPVLREVGTDALIPAPIPRNKINKENTLIQYYRNIDIPAPPLFIPPNAPTPFLRGLAPSVASAGINYDYQIQRLEKLLRQANDNTSRAELLNLLLKIKRLRKKALKKRKLKIN